MPQEKSNVVAMEVKKISSAQAMKRLREAEYDQDKHNARIKASYEALIQAGLRPLVLKPGIKEPVSELDENKKVIRGWDELPLPSRDDFTSLDNIGILTGEKGNGVIDIDCDIEDMRGVIERFLPLTPFKFGRYYGGDELVITHWLYRVTDSGKIDTHAKSPIADARGAYLSIEVRSNGSQTMAPGSTIIDHKRGHIVDSVRWTGDSLTPPKDKLPETTRAHLIKCVYVAVISKYCAQYFKPGAFHVEMMWWCGFLVSAGIEDELIEKSIEYLVEVSGQEDIQDRRTSIKTTRQLYEQGEQVAGIGFLKRSANWSADILRWAAKIINVSQKELDDDRPTVRIVASKEPQWKELTLEAMSQTEVFYESSDQLCVVCKKNDRARILTLDNSTNVGSWVSAKLRFVKGTLNDSTGVMVDEDIKCPPSLAKELSDPKTSKEYIKPIKGICTSPLITQTGRIVEDTWGYDNELQLFFASEFQYQPMYVDEAIKIFEDVTQDFPFLNSRYKASAIGAIITAVIRRVLDICPLFVITSSQYSDGKSVLSGLIAASVGVEASLGQLTRGGSDEEQEKQLSAILSRGRSVVTLDNHDGEFRSSALTEALTSVNPEFRVLGKNETRSVPNTTMFIVNGVNTIPALDLQTRSVFVRLARTSLGVDRKFKHADICGYAYENRARLVSAAISLIKHTLHSEDGNWKPNHRFKMWDVMVRKTIMTVFGEDIAPPVSEDSERSIDPVEEAKHEFFDWVCSLWDSGVRDSKFKNWIRGKTLSDIVAPNSPQEGWINTLSKRPNNAIDVRVGRCLNMIKDVPYLHNGATIRLVGAVTCGVSVYKIEVLGEK